jgi:hypothetical protein
VDKAGHRHDKNVACSHARRSFEAEGRDNGTPSEFHKELEVHIPFFRRRKSTGNEHSDRFA